MRGITNDPAEIQLLTAYQNLRNQYNNPNATVANLAQAINNFQGSLYIPIDTPANQPNYRPAHFRRLIQSIENRFLQELQNPARNFFLSSLVSPLYAHILNRRALSLLDEDASNNLGGRGVAGYTVLQTNNRGFAYTLHWLTGRIFSISTDQTGNVDINTSRLVSSSSGTLVNYNQQTDQLVNIVSGTINNFNSVLTCAHSFQSTNWARNAFYFLPTRLIDKNTGFPPRAANQNGINGFIDYVLRNAYQLTSLSIRNRNNPGHLRIDLTMGIPQYLQNEDLAIAPLNRVISQSLSSNVRFQINNQIPNVPAFAFGYPGARQYDNNITLLTRRLGLSPFFYTRKINPILNSLQDGRMVHDLSTAQGMSGGIILQEDHQNNALVLLGVIIADRLYCHWR